MLKVLLLAKKEDTYSNRAYSFLVDKGFYVEFYSGEWGDILPLTAFKWDGDIIISYLSRWVVPKELLLKAKLYCINFHPAPPKYRGYGGFNFALYNNDDEYGVTCHFMDEKIDSGGIIQVKRFTINQHDNLDSLITKSYEKMFEMFKDVVVLIQSNSESIQIVLNEKWDEKVYKRTNLNSLMKITLDMSKEEVLRRVRATSYLQYGPTLDFHGISFKYIP